MEQAVERVAVLLARAAGRLLLRL